jgi:3-hydroxyacyl-[acyl-carrier-protein] dehydratase
MTGRRYSRPIMRFELIDQVLERAADRIVAVKQVTVSEEYLADHFPTFPVLPGVLMLEAMVQAARRLLERADVGDGPWVVAQVRNVRYGNMVRPGQRLTVTVERTNSDGDRHSFTGTGEVDDEMAVQGRFVMRPLGQ